MFLVGTTVNHCIVAAQLYINGKKHGIHLFMVQIRDLETHMPLPGINVGEIGPKLGFQTANNGFLGFKNVRIPRKNMLMKNNQVLKVSIEHSVGRGYLIKRYCLFVVRR